MGDFDESQLPEDLVDLDQVGLVDDNIQAVFEIGEVSVRIRQNVPDVFPVESRVDPVVLMQPGVQRFLFFDLGFPEAFPLEERLKVGVGTVQVHQRHLVLL